VQVLGVSFALSLVAAVAFAFWLGPVIHVDSADSIE
jgi:hypothetical protein